MFDAALRPLKNRLLEPVARRLGTLSPDVVTVTSLILGVAAALGAARRAYGVALVLWLLNRTFDGLDGVLARVSGQQSDRGGYLDILADFLVYALLPIGMVVGMPSRANALAGLVVLGTFYLNAASWMYLAAVLERRGEGARVRGEETTVAMPAGLIAGTETIIAYSLFLLFPTHLATLFLGLAALVLVTVGQRVVWAWRRL